MFPSFLKITYVFVKCKTRDKQFKFCRIQAVQLFFFFFFIGSLNSQFEVLLIHDNSRAESLLET